MGDRPRRASGRPDRDRDPRHGLAVGAALRLRRRGVRGLERRARGGARRRAAQLHGPLGHVTRRRAARLRGRVRRHPRYGWQFVVESFHSALPQSADGVELWLRRRVPGIGPTFARAIVKHFGAEHVFAELDRDPERLREVRTQAGRAISRERGARGRGVARGRRDPRGRERSSSRTGSAPVSPRGSSASTATDVIAVLDDDPYRLTEVPRHRLQGRRPRRALARDRARRAAAAARRAALRAPGGRVGRQRLSAVRRALAGGRILGSTTPEPLESAVGRSCAGAEVVAERRARLPAELWEMESASSGARRARPRRRSRALRPAASARADPGLGRAVADRRARPHAAARAAHRASGRRQDAHAAGARRARAAGRRKRVLLCAPTGKAARRMRDLTGHPAMTIHRALGYSPMEAASSATRTTRSRTTTTS